MSAWEAEVEKELESKQFCPGDPGGGGSPRAERRPCRPGELQGLRLLWTPRKHVSPRDGWSEGGEAGVYPVAPVQLVEGHPWGGRHCSTFYWEGQGGLPGF